MKKTPWARRIISTTLLAALLFGLIFAVAKIVGSIFPGANPQSQQSETVQSQAVSGTIVPCQIQDLQISADVSTENPSVGEGFQVTLLLKNAGGESCSILDQSLELQLITGEDLVWTPIACTEGWAKTLLLGPEDSWQGDLNWDGIRYSGCDPATTPGDSSPMVAEPGTYRIRLLLDGKATKDLSVVTVQ